MNQILINKRSQLTEVNRMVLSLLSQRKKIVSEIQELKDTNHVTIESYKNFDPNRESELYYSLSRHLKNLSLKELLALSLLIEDHADAPTHYPSWFEKVHLKKSDPHQIFERINPLLLFIAHKEKFDQLLLKDDFEFLRQKID